MSIRKNTNPTQLALPPEMQDLLHRNGMRAQVMGSSNGFTLVVQGHDSPVLSYPITEKQLKALTDWGTNFSNKRCYNTFASIVAEDFDMPRDYVHARNANGRVAMGLHGYRIGVGEYGRMPMRSPWMARPFWGDRFLGWTPRQQEGWHLRRIGGGLYFPAGAPMVPTRPDGRMKPGELQNGGYGFYYKGDRGYEQGRQPVREQDVLKDLQDVIGKTPVRERQTEPAIPLKDHIQSDVYFSNDKWQEVLASHGIVIDAEAKTLTIQSQGVNADFQYDLSQEELNSLTSNPINDIPLQTRLDIINYVIKDDFKDSITMDMLNSDKQISVALHDELQQDLQKTLTQGQETGYDIEDRVAMDFEQRQQKGIAMIDGRDLEYINGNKGWFREGQHGREVSVDAIRVEPTNTGKYKMTAVIDGEVISHEITQKQYDKFMNIDDFHRMKLFSKIFPEVDMKSRGDGVGIGVKISAALAAGLTVAHELSHCHMAPDIYMEHHHGPEHRAYFKPGVDTPMDVAARNFEAAMNTEMMHHEIHRGM